MLITNGGKVLRCAASGISSMGRNTQGVRIINPAEGESLVAVARLAEGDEGGTSGGSGDAPGGDA
jgi:DNA gyrase subunit A